METSVDHARLLQTARQRVAAELVKSRRHLEQARSIASANGFAGIVVRLGELHEQIEAATAWVRGRTP